MRRASACLVEVDGGLVGVDQGEEFDVWVAELAARVVVTEVVDSVDRAQNVVANEPVAVTMTAVSPQASLCTKRSVQFRSTDTILGYDGSSAP